jgi:drug/metabolite transporter (DMT)-like permease
MKTEKSKKSGILSTMHNERIRIWIGFIVVCTVWGSTWMVIKIGLQSIPPFFAAGIRFSVASLLLFLILRVRRLNIPMTPDAKKVYLALGVLSFGLPFALVYWGQQFIPSGLSSILFAAYPFWVAIFSHLMLPNEPLNVPKILGVVIGFAGLVVVFSGDIHWSDSRGLLGMSAVMLSTLLQAFTLVVIKKHGQHVSPFAMNFVGMLMGAAGLLGLGFLTESVKDIVWNSAAIGSILYLGIIGSVLTFVSYYWLLKRIEAVYLSLTSFINPIVAVILGAMVLHETMPPSVFLGASLVLVGILTANTKSLYEKFHRPA